MMRGNGNLFSAKVIATNKVYYDDRLRYLNVRTLDGQIGFMAHHAPIVVAVDIGVLDMQKPDGSWEHAEVGKGILQFANNRLTLLVDTLETKEEMDIRRAEEAKERAEEELRQKQSYQEFKKSQAALARALGRLEFYKKTICRKPEFCQNAVFVAWIFTRRSAYRAEDSSNLLLILSFGITMARIGKEKEKLCLVQNRKKPLLQ